MKKLLLISLTCLLVFSFTITGLAKVNLVYWTYPSCKVEGLLPGEYEQIVIDQFEKEYPEVKIELQVLPYDGGIKKVELSILSQTSPDILIDNTFRMGKFADAGLLVPFELTEDERNDFFPFAIEACTFNNEMGLWPTAVSAQGMTVSKRIAKEAGALDLLPLDRSDRTWTTEEYGAFLRKVASVDLPEVRGYILWLGDANGMQTHIMLMLQAFGAEPFIKEDGKYRCIINSPEAIEGLEYFLELYNTPGCFMEGAENLSCFDNSNYFNLGTIATSGASIPGILKGLEGTDQISADYDLALFPFPSKKGVSNGALLSMTAFGVFDNDDQEKVKYAQMFVRYFVKNAKDFLHSQADSSPVMKSSEIPEVYQKYKDNPEVQYYLNVLPKFGKDYGTMCPVYQQYKEAFRVVMQGAVTGELTAKEALDEMARKVNKLLDEYYEE